MIYSPIYLAIYAPLDNKRALGENDSNETAAKRPRTSSTSPGKQSLGRRAPPGTLSIAPFDPKSAVLPGANADNAHGLLPSALPHPNQRTQNQQQSDQATQLQAAQAAQAQAQAHAQAQVAAATASVTAPAPVSQQEYQQLQQVAIFQRLQQQLGKEALAGMPAGGEKALAKWMTENLAQRVAVKGQPAQNMAQVLQTAQAAVQAAQAQAMAQGQGQNQGQGGMLRGSISQQGERKPSVSHTPNMGGV